MIGTFHKDMEKAREDFVDLLREYRREGMHDITVVFDGHRSGSGVEQVTLRGGIRVVYSRIAESADEVIARIIKTQRREWIVVTSDRMIAQRAWAVNSIPVPSDQFLELVSRQVKRRGADDDDAEERSGRKDDVFDKDVEAEEMHRPRRGSPRQLSKKERAVRRALAKLSTELSPASLSR